MPDPIAFKPLLEQHGHVTSFPLWIPRALPSGSGIVSFNVPGNATYTQTYDFEPRTDAAGNLVEDRVYFSSAPQGRYFTWTVATDLTSPRGDLQLEYRYDPEFPLWSSGYYPGISAEVGAVVLDADITASSSYWVENGSTYDLVFNLDLNSVIGDTFTGTSIMRLVNERLWNGRLALLLTNLSASSFNVQFDMSTYSRGSLDGWYVPANTGWAGATVDSGRPINDMKTGLPTTADAVSEDGYYHGIWTQAKSYDAEDPRNIRSVEFPPDEGVRKDDVPA